MLLESIRRQMRSFLPIKKEDIGKLIPMTFILFFICLNYSLLRNLKDSIVVIAADSAAVIPFIKVWFMLPMAVLMTFIFTRLSNRMSQEKVFYVMTSGFLIFYALFAFVLHPYQKVLQPNVLADAAAQVLPEGFGGLIAALRNWSLTLFYVMAELWSSIVMTVLFWGFANEVTKVSQARYFYSVFGIGSNLAAIAAGLFGIYFSDLAFNPNIPFGNTGWEQSLMGLVTLIVVLGIAAMAIFRWMNKCVLTDPAFESLHVADRPLKKKKKKLSFSESFTLLSKSRYLLCIAVIVISYNLVINLVEVVWKDMLRLEYPTTGEYNTYMSYVTMIIGGISTVTTLFMPKLIGRMGWTWTAMMTPVVILLTSIGFFGFYVFRDYLTDVMMVSLGMTPIALAVFFGTAQNCLSKAAKYSVFDTTKEMAFIPLGHEAKLKGKAAIDGVGSRFGKSGGSLIHQGLLMVFGTLTVSAPYVAFFLLSVVGLWIAAVRLLGIEFNAIVHGEEREEQEELSSEEPEVATVH